MGKKPRGALLAPAHLLSQPATLTWIGYFSVLVLDYFLAHIVRELEMRVCGVDCDEICAGYIP